MSTASDYDVVSRFPLAEVITPATVLGLAVAVGGFAISVTGSPPPRFTSQMFTNTFVNRLITTLIGSVGTIGLLAAILAVVTAGPEDAIVVGGSVLTYLAGLVASLLNRLYADPSGLVDPGLVLGPLAAVLLFLAVAVGARWVEGDAPW